MKETQVQVLIIGGGPGGLAAAVALHDQGIRDILIVEREKALGGILRQCIHDGFGLTRFRESLSGPEYADRFIQEVERRGIPFLTEATVIEISGERRVRAATREGMKTWNAEAIVLTMGCRERTRGALQIPGERPAGVFTAGVAQSYVNLYNTMVGERVVILGSGDIGLIMARRMTLEGAKVEGVYEILPYPSGLERNVEQCLHDFEIPLHLSHTVTRIHGGSRIEGVTVSQVDGDFNAILGTEKVVPCDTLILSVGLIPENELSKMAGVELDGRTKGPLVDESYETSVKGIFAAGNVLHVHDLVDHVSLESERLAQGVARYLKGSKVKARFTAVKAGKGISYVLPQKIAVGQDAVISMRVKAPCEDVKVVVRHEDTVLASLLLEEALPAEMIQVALKGESIPSEGVLEVEIL